MKTLRSRKKSAWWKHVTGVLVFLLIWELSVRLGLFSSQQLSPPSQVIETFFTKLTDPRPDGETLGVHFLASFSVTLGGFSLACLIGIPLGLLMGYYRPVYLLVNPIFELLRPIPPIAWIPIVTLLLGIGAEARIFIIFLSAIVPAVINSYTGIQRTPQTYIHVGQSLGMSRWRIFTRICIPYALPTLFTGVRLSLSTAWAALVAAEMMASVQGLGYMIQMGRLLIKPDIIITGMLTIGCSGALMSLLLTLLENRLTKWGR